MTTFEMNHATDRALNWEISINSNMQNEESVIYRLSEKE